MLRLITPLAASLFSLAVWTATATAQPELAQISLDGVSLKMARVPKGNFWMGGGGGKEGTKQQEVGEFYMGVYEVTQAQWKAVMGADNNQSKFKGDDLPVETVSWNDVKKFIDALNQKKKGSGYVYRLPTEVEWEYACRGGATSQKESAFDFYFDQPTNDLSSDQANFNGGYPAGKAAKSKSLGKTAKVGSYKPNKLGLYDMHGNVWEWTDTLDISRRVLRGGFWNDRGQSCTAAARLYNAPVDLNENLGFRLAASRPSQNEAVGIVTVVNSTDRNDVKVAVSTDGKATKTLTLTKDGGAASYELKGGNTLTLNISGAYHNGSVTLEIPAGSDYHMLVLQITQNGFVNVGASKAGIALKVK